MARKTWEEKFSGSKDIVVKTAPKDFADIKAGQQMLLTSPQAVDAYLRTIPEGKSLSVKELRAGLAAKHGADIACPVVTGIHLRIVAEVANAKLEAGIDPGEVTPVWRALEPGATALKKLDGGATHMLTQREAEGLAV